MSQVKPEMTVGQLVSDRPSRSRVFEKLGIDYCCGGKKPLAEACEKHGLDCGTVVLMLQAMEEISAGSLVDAAALSLSELCDHVEQTHHAYLKRELPRLGAMVRRVASVHGDRYPWMIEADRVLAGLAPELISHLNKEEQVLFPWIRAVERGEGSAGAAARGSVANPIRMMEHEHDDAGAALEELRRLTSDYTPPADACNTFRAALDGLADLERDMHQHVHKENNVLFPRALAAEAA